MDRAEREATIDAWSRPPVAGVNLSPLVPLGLSDPMFKTWLLRTRKAHWAQKRARNLRGLLPTAGPARRIMDYGCGFGMDVLEYVEAGHDVIAADINPLNLAVTRRAVNVIKPGGLEYMHVVSPIFGGESGVGDLVFSLLAMNGVFHHIKDAAGFLADVAGREFPPDLWLMVYTDKAWRDITKSEPPDNPAGHELFSKFVQEMDDNGHYATFYSERTMGQVLAPNYDLTGWQYVEPDGWFAVATASVRGA